MESSCESWRLAIEYEKRLRAEQRKKQAFDPSIRALRKSVREAYEQSLFEDYAFSQAHDVEQQLWKVCYYRPIEEFRKRIKEATATAAGAAPHGGVTAKEGAEQLPKVTAAYRAFLTEASVNYRLLAARLQAAYGNLGVDLQLEPGAMAQVAAYAAACSARTAGQRVDVRPSVHRCLVFLGDLARYASQVQHPEPGQQKVEQERAVRYYQLAASVMPSSGNPYNQLAVMAYLSKQELLSVYYYFRALGVSNPFLTARDNLLILFEHNRTRYASLAAGAAPSMSSISTRYVRLVGLLYDRINLETTADVRDAASKGLRMALADPNFLAATTSCHPASSLLLQLATVLIYSAHALAAGPGSADTGTAASSAEATQRPFLRRVALVALFDFATCLCSAVTSPPANKPANTTNASSDSASSGAMSTLDGLLAPLSVVLSWLASSSADPLNSISLHPANASTTTQVKAGPSPLKQNPLDEVGAAQKEVLMRGGLFHAVEKLAKHLHPLLPANTGLHEAAGTAPPDGRGAAANQLPEVKELLGFVPLAEAHHVCTQQGSGPQRSAGSGLPKSASRAMLAGQMSLGSSTDTNGMHAHATAMEIDGVTGSEEAGRPQPLSERELRIQQVWFWVTSLARKAEAAADTAAANLGKCVTALALNSFKKASMDLTQTMQQLSALTEQQQQQQQQQGSASHPTAAQRTSVPHAPSAQHTGNGHAVAADGLTRAKQKQQGLDLQAALQQISQQQAAQQQGALENASLRSQLQQGAVENASLQQTISQQKAEHAKTVQQLQQQQQQSRSQQPLQQQQHSARSQVQQQQHRQDDEDEADDEEQVVYRPLSRQHTPTPPSQSPSTNGQAAVVGLKQPPPLVASHPIMSASSNTLAGSSKRSSAIMDSAGAAAIAAAALATPAIAQGPHQSHAPQQQGMHADLPVPLPPAPPPFPPSSFLSHLSHGSHSPRSAVPTTPPSPVAGVPPPLPPQGASNTSQSMFADGRPASTQAGVTAAPPITPRVQPSSKLMMRASLTSSTSGPLIPPPHPTPSNSTAPALQPSAKSAAALGTSGPGAAPFSATSAPAGTVSAATAPDSTMAPPPPMLPSTVSPTMAAAARVLLPPQQHSDQQQPRQPGASAGPAIPAAALAAARAAAAAVAAQVQQGASPQQPVPTKQHQHQQGVQISSSKAVPQVGSSRVVPSPDGPLPPAPQSSTAVANVMAAARQGLQTSASPPQPGPPSPSMTAAAVAGANVLGAAAKHGVARPKLSMSAMDTAGPGSSTTPSPTAATALLQQAPAQQQTAGSSGVLAAIQTHMPYQPNRTSGPFITQPLLGYAPHMNQAFNRYSQPAPAGGDGRSGDGSYMNSGASFSNRYYADAMASRALEVTALSTVNQLGLSQSPTKDDYHAGLAGTLGADRLQAQPNQTAANQPTDGPHGGWLGSGRLSAPVTGLGRVGPQTAQQDASQQGLGHAGQQTFTYGPGPMGAQHTTDFLLQSTTSLPPPTSGTGAMSRPQAAVSAQQLRLGQHGDQGGGEFGTAGFTFLDMLQEEGQQPQTSPQAMSETEIHHHQQQQQQTSQHALAALQQQAYGQGHRGVSVAPGSLVATATAAITSHQHHAALSRGSNASHTQPHSGSSTRHSSGHHAPVAPGHFGLPPQRVDLLQTTHTGPHHQQQYPGQQQQPHYQQQQQPLAGQQQQQQAQGLSSSTHQPQQYAGLQPDSGGPYRTNSWQQQSFQPLLSQQPSNELPGGTYHPHTHNHTHTLPHQPVSAPMNIERHHTGDPNGQGNGHQEDLLSTGGQSGGWRQHEASLHAHPQLPQLPNSLEL